MRYEFAVGINLKNIVWVNRPFLAWSYSDLKKFCDCLISTLGKSEKVIADRGYRDEDALTP